MKRSTQPVFWLLFGAGGMLSALIGAALVFATGIAAPMDVKGFEGLTSYEHVLAFSRHWAGKAFVFAVVALFTWHGAHRIYHSLHDFGIPTGLAAKVACYGLAFLATVTAATALVSIGF